jgi:hypothetical protein
MSMQRIEIQHNDPEQLIEYVNTAIDIVREHVPVEYVSPELFVKVLDLVSGKTIQQVQPAPIGVPIGVPRMDIPRGGRH